MVGAPDPLVLQQEKAGASGAWSSGLDLGAGSLGLEPLLPHYCGLSHWETQRHRRGRPSTPGCPCSWYLPHAGCQVTLIPG